MEASREVSRQVELQQQAQSQPRNQEPDFLERGADIWNSVGAGMLKAGLETKDFLVGEPEQSVKSQLRIDIENKARDLSEKHVANSITIGISQFVTGMIGAGKITAPLKIAQMGKAGMAGNEVLKGAVAGAVVIDPHEERLSNLIEQYPALQNPVSAYLAADPSDSAAEGRLKNALEGIGLDLTLAGAFGGAAKAFKLFKNGDDEAAKATIESIDHVDRGATAQPSKQLNDAAAMAAVEGLSEESPELLDGLVKSSPSPTNPTEITQEVPVFATKLGSASSKPKVSVSQGDVDAILKSSGDDLAAINRFGSREAAEAAGHRFGSGGSLPWQKLRSTADVRTFIENATAQVKGQMDKVKGGEVLTDARLQSLINQRVKIYGEDPDLILGKIRQSGESAKSMVADMETGLLVANKMATDTFDTVFKIRNGMLDEWSGDLNLAQEELKARLTATLDALGSANSMRSAAGRALRRNRSEFKISPQSLENIQSLDGDRLVEAIYLTKGDLSRIKDVTSPSFLTRVADEASFSLVNSLLWLYPTHVVNFTSNLFMMAARPTEKLIGSAFMGAMGRPIRQQAVKEYGYMLSSLGDAWEAASEAFMRGDSVLTPHAEEFFENGRTISSQQRIPWKPIKNVGDILDNLWKSVNYRTVVGLPTRALGTFDELMKTARYRGVVQAQAHVDGTSRGLKGVDLVNYVQTKLSDSFDEHGRGTNPAAVAEAQVTTFQQELLPKTLGSTIQNARSNLRPLEFILPFVKTPTNVIRYSWKMTPGLNMLQKEYQQAILGKKGAEAQAHSIGQMLMGTIGLTLAAHMALSGRITGGGPSNPKVKAELLATGWKPYSFVTLKDDGSRSYFPIGRFDPVGMVFGIAADLVDTQVLHPNAKGNGDAISATALALAQNFSDRSFMQNFNQLLRALSEPEDNLERYLGGMAGNIIPGSSAIRGYVNQDPYMRDARGFVDTMLRNMPGYSETLPPKRDAFGEPVWKRIGLSSSQSSSVVEDEHNRLIEATGSGISTPTPMKHGVDLRDLKLERGRSAYDVYQEYVAQPMPQGKTLKQVLERLIQSKQYSLLIDGDITTHGSKLFAIGGVVADFRKAAFQRLLKESKVVRDAVMQKRRDVKAELLAKKSQQPNSDSQSILDKIGIRQ